MAERWRLECYLKKTMAWHERGQCVVLVGLVSLV